MKILFFAWLRTKAGVDEADIELPPDVADVSGLMEWLKGEGDGYREAFADIATVRAAVNQEHVQFDHPVKEGDEVAFFPPVTGS